MSLFDVRTELVASLEGVGLKVFAYGPAKINPGSVVIEEGSPYISEGDLLDRTQMQVSYDLWLFERPEGNQKATKTMDDMIETVVFSLGDWTLTNADAHFIAAVGDSHYLASKLSVTKILTIGEL